MSAKDDFKTYMTWAIHCDRKVYCPKPIIDFEFDYNGKSALEGFILYDSQGIIVKTRHPRLLKLIIQSKASLNFQITEWAEGMRMGVTFLFELEDFFKEIGLPRWVLDATHNRAKQIFLKKLHKNNPEAPVVGLNDIFFL